MGKFINFIKYNNAFSIAISFVFLATSASFAASEEAREVVYKSEEIVRSVDNSLIVSINLESFDYNLQINEVREDEYNYYVDYSYQTLAIDDYVWKVVEKNETLKVSKEALEMSYLKDLGLYTAKNLSDKINAEAYYLARAQKLEREKGLSQKIVATEYSGLVGRFINTKEKVVEGYSPVIALMEREAKEIMDSSEISARTKEALIERRKLEIEEQKRLAEEKEKLQNASSTPAEIVDGGNQDGGAVLGEDTTDQTTNTTNESNTTPLQNDETAGNSENGETQNTENNNTSGEEQVQTQTGTQTEPMPENTNNNPEPEPATPPVENTNNNPEPETPATPVEP